MFESASIIWNVIYVLGCIMGGYIIFNEFTDKKKSGKDELALKVKELEGKIETQYTELNQKLANLEKTLVDDKARELHFESRVINLLDKTELKIDSTKDLLLKLIINKVNLNNEK